MRCPVGLQNDIKWYAILRIALSVCAVPLLLMEYYYTKERVIEDADAESEGGNSNRVPLKEQLKAMFTDRFYVILIVLMTMQGLIDNFKGGNVQYYYVQYRLGGATHPAMQMHYSIATGAHLVIGICPIWSPATKFGLKNDPFVSYSLASHARIAR